MRLMLYNVRYCAGTGGRFHFPFPLSGYLKRSGNQLGRITEFIGSQHPDIVGLVEVDAGSYRSLRRNQASHIAAALGHYHVDAVKYGLRSWARLLPVLNKQSNAFLSSDVIRDKRFHYFDRGMKRLVIELELDRLTVFLVHLSLKFRQRHAQLSDLYAMVKETTKPVIVAGDFNVLWGDAEIDLFLAATGLRSANREGWRSYPSWAPRRQLDFVLYGPGIQLTHFAMPQVTYSDHLPLVCDFELEGAPTADVPV